ncbi:glutamine--fructose-6-phosphate transaminase (isomerizing) [Thalassospiraceae bacterium LMO-JJ14]|nr:glutamine--fructose-6-phosphate transaminase (isomerizing) [Thalassospiraceae bacterium LMO-JJ14]
MCGIIGIVGNNPATPRLLEALKRLEYRGYDSAGIATLVNGGIERRRAEGKLANLGKRLQESPLEGTTGIGHTRWATHGVPNVQNAHPHATDRVAVVHNGIIENFRELRQEVAAAGCTLASETDTEIIAHLVTLGLKAGLSPKDAVFETLKKLQGAYALGFIFSGEHNLMAAARHGSPLALGFGEHEMYLGSDALALAPLTNRILYMEDGDWAMMTASSAEIFDSDGHPVERPIRLTELSGAAIGKGGYRHFMLKEIYEQPQVIGDTLHSLVNPAERRIIMPEGDVDLAKAEKITLIACGTSYYACMTAKYWFESLARIPVEVDIASEYRYRDPVPPQNGVAIFISQSGETIDTLAALRHAKQGGQKILSIVNALESAIARESDAVLQTLAGPEIGVASTKAFTTQLTVLACLAIATAEARGTISGQAVSDLVGALTEVPARAAEVLNHDDAIRTLAATVAEARDVLYLGRGTNYPIALEGALKLKEISYIHAEGYAAGEMKHGPIALIDEAVPIICIAPEDKLFEKTASNIQEVKARGGKVIVFTDHAGARQLQDCAEFIIALPAVNAFVSPILYAIPVQLLAYHVAVIKGTDVDQPRNLAKSVTVE